MIAWTAETLYAVTIVSGREEFEKALADASIMRRAVRDGIYMFDVADATKVRRILDVGEQQSVNQADHQHFNSSALNAGSDVPERATKRKKAV